MESRSESAFADKLGHARAPDGTYIFAGMFIYASLACGKVAAPSFRALPTIRIITQLAEKARKKMLC
jgi:hypothetical protein